MSLFLKNKNNVISVLYDIEKSKSEKAVLQF